MEHPWIPRWIINVTYYAWKFVSGAFGNDVPPPPHPFKICGPFWASLAGLTIGLPIVLLAWVIRLVVGKARANKLWEPFKIVAVFTILAVYIGVAVAYLAFLIFSIAQETSWLFALGVIAGASLAFFGFLVLLVEAMDFLFGKSNESTSRTYEQQGEHLETRQEPSTSRKALRNIWKASVFPFRVVWQTIRFVALMAHAGYRRYCPLVVKEA